MKVCLYGDSYVDDAITCANTISWTAQLANDYDNIHNYGKSGSGPEYSLSMLRQHGGDLVIFITGKSERLPFPNLPHPGLAVDISNIYYYKHPLSSVKDSLRDYISTHSSSIKYLFRTLREHIRHRTEEIISYLSYYANTTHSYILCIPTTNPFLTQSSKESVNGAVISIPQAILDHFRSKYFSLYPYNLASVSLNEYTTQFKQTIKASIGYTDLRQNHLSQCNHNILYHNIHRILEHEKTEEHSLHFLNETYSGHTYIYDE